jgi:hypothetical protein
MNRHRTTLRTRDKLIGKLPVTSELLRGSLLERTVRHTKLAKCARGEGHRVLVLTVTYALCSRAMRLARGQVGAADLQYGWRTRNPAGVLGEQSLPSARGTTARWATKLHVSGICAWRLPHRAFKG